MKVAVFGLGYAGMVSAACIARNGHEVWGIDIDPDKVATVERGESPVVEPGLDEIIAAGIADGTLHATTDAHLALDGADVALICVGTPSTDHGRVDLAHIEAAAAEIGRVSAEVAPPASGRRYVVVRSTVPPGTVDGLVANALARTETPGVAFGVAMCPEFLREGTGVADFFDPPFTVVGADDPQTGEVIAEVFSHADARLRIVPLRTAESLKYACNAFHATKVAFANEVARLFRGMGVDAREMMELFCEDERLNISPTYLRPGFAFGGSCLPKDLRALLHLARMSSVDLPLLAATLQSNEITISDVVDRVIANGGRNVALLGLSFKSNTDDLRESPNVALAETLIGKGFNVRIYDPIVNPTRLIGTNKTYVESRLPHLRRLLTDSAEAAIADADVVIVSSNAAPVVDALLANPPRQLIDISGRLGGDVEQLPSYSGIGW
jgi:GDP-mannose 6-dehydrogenase